MKYILFSILALQIGSFANVCIYRWPLNKSILFPVRSECPWCKQTIPWWANIPLFSFLFLSGKCHNCSSSISWRYPLIEFSFLLLGILLMLFLHFFSISLPAIYLISIGVLFFCLIVTTATDFDWKIIPDQPLVLTISVALLAAPWNPLINHDGKLMALHSSLLGAAISFFLLFVMTIIGEWIFERDAIGLGDVKLFGTIGAFIGIENAIHVLLLSSLIGGPIALLAVRLGLINRHHYIPFAPFLNISTFLVLLRSLHS